MKKTICIILIIATVLCCSFALFGCNKEKGSVDTIKENGELVIATSANFPPFEYKDEAGNIVGWDMDLAQAFADKLGVKLVISNMEFDSVLLSVASKKADIGMAGISYSEKRDETVDFTKGVFDSTQVIIVKNDSAIAGPFDLGGKIVGAQSATVGHLLATMDPDWAGEGEDACLAAPKEARPFTTGAEAVLALQNGQVDAVIIDRFPAEKFVEQYEGVKIAAEPVFEDTYAFAVSEGNKELVDWLNTAIDELKADGTFQKINDKYFGEKK